MVQLTVQVAMVVICFLVAPVAADPLVPEERPKLLHTLKGYSYGLSFSPDGKTLAAGGLTPKGTLHADRDIVLWDVTTGKEKARLQGQRNVVAVAFGPDGKTLATGGEDLRVWDVESRKVARSVGKQVSSLAFSPDGKTLATGSSSDAKKTNALGLWEVGTLRPVEPGPTTDDTSRVAFSPDGKTLAYVRNSVAEIGLWDVAVGKERIRIDMATRPKPVAASVLALALSPDGKTLAVGVTYARPRSFVPEMPWEEKDIHLWDMTTGKYVDKLVGHDRRVLAVEFSPDGKLLASSGGGGLKIWDVASKKVLITMQVGAGTIAFSPDGKLLATASRGGDINLWSLDRGK